MLLESKKENATTEIPISNNLTNITEPNWDHLFGDPEQGIPINSALATCFLIGGCFAACISIFVSVINMFNKKLDRQRNFRQSSSGAKTISLSLITEIPVSAWYVIVLFMCFYSAMFPFNSILPGFLKDLGYKKEVAGNLASVVYAFSCIGSPLFGFIIDAAGFHSVWLTFCSALLSVSFISWGYLQQNIFNDDSETMILVMYGLMIALGVAYSIISSSAMKYMVEVTPADLHPTCFGLLMGIQQIGIGITSYLSGYYIEHYGYVNQDANFLYCFGFVGILATVCGFGLILNDGIDPFNKGNEENEVDSSQELEELKN